MHNTNALLEKENISVKETCKHSIKAGFFFLNDGCGYFLCTGASLEEQVKILKNGLETTTETLTDTNEELESVKRESHDRQVTVEELEEELRITKQELEV